ncbi:hypothetical protein K1804_002925 [Listeria monocytogenes]|uniref:hypothetical protein n=1 Tax=Listeria seeligeri TaxID=1640 RepID=UPI001628A366|nr:hypothetical protein [Listeria seeligeri]EFM0818567.1 hypothetical protein [Listeria monocytogenes]EFM2966952.1 hypothetical protein [Listeria monocytogenes]EHX3821621.1 hypothetical protein [Listeria monocytogenes]EHX3879533.1 hypothetical protein [Listeria monocytogenes]MBC1597638.1 hypothetical protein [Listeria seeligeri]
MKEKFNAMSRKGKIWLIVVIVLILGGLISAITSSDETATEPVKEDAKTAKPSPKTTKLSREQLEETHTNFLNANKALKEASEVATDFTNGTMSKEETVEKLEDAKTSFLAEYSFIQDSLDAIDKPDEETKEFEKALNDWADINTFVINNGLDVLNGEQDADTDNYEQDIQTRLYKLEDSAKKLGLDLN